MNKKILNIASLILLASIALAACGTPSTQERLMSQVWTLGSMVVDGAEVPLDGSVTTTIEFMEDGTYSGNAGCNTYSGTYTTDGSSITLGVAASTLMACETGMEQEAVFLAALPRVTTYEVTAEGMRLLSADRSVSLTFPPNGG